MVAIGNRRLLAAVDAGAAGAGLSPGMSLADARARIPDLLVLPADPIGDREALTALARWCGRWSPHVAPCGADGLWLDVTGMIPLFPDEASLAGEALDRLRRLGFACRGAIADTPGAAWALARFQAGAEPLVVPPGETAAALAPLPVAGLRLPESVLQDLNRLGLRRIGALYPLPRAPLAPRFGELVARRLDQALGRLEEPISPLAPIIPRTERLGFAEPPVAAPALAQAIGVLVERLCRRLEGEGLGARRLVLGFHRVDGHLQEIEIGTSRPNRTPSHLCRLLEPKLEQVDPGLGIEFMMLAAAEVEALIPAQPGLGKGPAALRDEAALVAPLVDRLAGRLGAPKVIRLVAGSSRVPERAMRRLPALGHEDGPPGTWALERPRPIRLLSPPDPIEVVAPVPDDPPLLFRWRHVTHRVRRAEGPERIAAEWWRDPALARVDAVRDYYRIEDESGRRFWLFRRGLYRPDPPPRWFLHGFFP